MMKALPIEVLLIEDNAGDVRLTQEALFEASVRNNVQVAKGGVEALALLRRDGAFAECPRPDLILLDLNLPKKGGLEVLDEIKVDPLLMHIPVVILTTSKSDSDVLQSYRRKANAYVTKPVDLEQFLLVVKSIENFWLANVKLSRP